ncbi:SPOR domain-containing protein [Octadecabacter sp. R77987]|uniref:SPOR domain-containing protein n=1 Tax=Octadecabacter sp. R77987 TaxID=3093874 RepID=UPI00366B3A0F
MSGKPFKRLINFKFPAAIAVALTIAGCDDNGQFIFAGGGAERAGETGEATTRSVELVERDVEAPEVFQVTEPGLWDGRPSLGGVWVAHPDVQDPERVIIRNDANGTFVIGALFRRERDSNGPALQVSSDAATALEMLAGAPADLNVTALRREEAPVAPTTDAVTDFAEPSDIAAAPIEETPLDPIAGAAAAIDAAETTAAAAPAPVAAPAPRAPSDLEKPFIQIGIFSIEANATGTADRMRATGIVPTVLEQESQGRPFWRVIVGPASSAAERAELLEKVKAQGFSDAYFVTN